MIDRSELDHFVRYTQPDVLRDIRAPSNRHHFDNACSKLYLAYKTPLRNRIARSFGHHPDAVDEAVQHAFATALYQISDGKTQLEDSESLLPWLGTIAFRYCIDVSRKIRVRRRHADIENKQEAAARGDLEPSEETGRSTLSVIESVLGRLGATKPLFAEVLRLRDLEDLPPQDVATRLGISGTDASHAYYNAKREVSRMALELLEARNPRLHSILELTISKRMSFDHAARKLGLPLEHVARCHEIGREFILGHFTELMLDRAPDWIWDDLKESVVTHHLTVFGPKKGAKK